jgi:hypothetical protein
VVGDNVLNPAHIEGFSHVLEVLKGIPCAKLRIELVDIYNIVAMTTPRTSLEDRRGVDVRYTQIMEILENFLGLKKTKIIRKLKTI